jgi:cytosine/adenosine deaminase-related metal-dependent hydrolase
MPSSLIRGKYVVCKVRSRHEAHVIDDGAVFQRDGVIVETGKFDVLSKKHTADEVLGSERHIVFPGFVNCHHHVGLTGFQMGTPDMALELWFSHRLRKRDVDPYLDTLYLAFEMIESGITTIQHLHNRVNGNLECVHAAANRLVKAYQDVGMRVSYSYGLRDQNRAVYEPDDAFLKRLPADLRQDAAELISAQGISLEENFELFEQLHGEHRRSERVRIQLAPVNLHWCSDRALAMVRDCAAKYEVPLHMHILETRYQKEYARRRCGGTAVSYLRKLGLLGPNMTIGHGVWITEADIDLLAESGTLVCHNPSSNLRLRSGIAPVNALEKRGVRVALGLDDCSINDDRSMLQEMRVALKVHRVPGMDDSVPTPAQVFQMATEHGGRTTPYGTTIGTLEAGKAADMVVMDWKHIEFPYLDADVPVVDALVHLARASGVETVIVAGEPILRDGRFTRIDKNDVLEELAASLRVPLKPHEERRRDIAKRLFPHIKQFYADEGYLGETQGVPFYHLNCRH